MKFEDNCFYCTKDDRLKKFAIEICDLKVSTLYLFKEQTYKGRCIVSYKAHETELFDMEPDEMVLFMKDVSNVASAIYNAFNADKINYGAYGDNVPHMHIHLVPKYKAGESWGSVFEMNPKKIYLSEDEYNEMIKTIKMHLSRP